MHIALQGLLVGIAAGVGLFVIDYMLLRKVVVQRAQAAHQKPVFDQNERRHVASMLRLCLMIPPLFALAAWWIWGG